MTIANFNTVGMSATPTPRMLDVLLLRLTGPLMAFGEPLVEKHNRVGIFPGLAMLTGLLANAMGWHHRDVDALNMLQRHLSYAALCDRPGVALIDYQTVDFSQKSLTDTGWTTRHQREDRAGGEASSGTHIRYRHYRADALCYVALTLAETAALPSLHDIEAALRRPARPLFLGRKTCLPSAPILMGHTRAERLVDALRQCNPAAGMDTNVPAEAMWPVEETPIPPAGARLAIRVDGRDWRHQQHVGERQVWIGRLPT